MDHSYIIDQAIDNNSIRIKQSGFETKKILHFMNGVVPAAHEFGLNPRAALS
jgi:hypothetical protein